MKKNNLWLCLGFTLVEVLTAVVVVGLLTAMAIPVFGHIMQRYEANGIYYQTKQALNGARSYAITRRHDVSVCGLALDRHSCSRDWSQGVLIYLEKMPQGFQAEYDEVLEIVPFHVRYGRLTYNRPSIRFESGAGLALVGNGTLRYCSQNIHYARAVIISHMIQIRTSTDKNGDGIHEGADGRNIDCSV